MNRETICRYEHKFGNFGERTKRFIYPPKQQGAYQFATTSQHCITASYQAHRTTAKVHHLGEQTPWLLQAPYTVIDQL